jgi:hypothetical protein
MAEFMGFVGRVDSKVIQDPIDILSDLHVGDESCDLSRAAQCVSQFIDPIVGT